MRPARELQLSAGRFILGSSGALASLGLAMTRFCLTGLRGQLRPAAVSHFLCGSCGVIFLSVKELGFEGQPYCDSEVPTSPPLPWAVGPACGQSSSFPGPPLTAVVATGELAALASQVRSTDGTESTGDGALLGFLSVASLLLERLLWGERDRERHLGALAWWRHREPVAGAVLEHLPTSRTLGSSIDRWMVWMAQVSFGPSPREQRRRRGWGNVDPGPLAGWVDALRDPAPAPHCRTPGLRVTPHAPSLVPTDSAVDLPPRVESSALLGHACFFLVIHRCTNQAGASPDSSMSRTPANRVLPSIESCSASSSESVGSGGRICSSSW